MSDIKIENGGKRYFFKNLLDLIEFAGQKFYPEKKKQLWFFSVW